MIAIIVHTGASDTATRIVGVSQIDCVESAFVFRHFRVAVSRLWWCQNQIVSFRLVLLDRNRHRLIQFVFDYLTRGRSGLSGVDGAGVGGTLTLEALTSGCIVGLGAMGAEGLTHVGVALLFLVEQVVGRRYMVVSVGLHAANCVLFLEGVVFNQLKQKVSVPWHFLQTWKESSLTARIKNVTLDMVFHVRVRADILNCVAGSRVRIEDLRYEVFALAAQKFGHLIIG